MKKVYSFVLSDSERSELEGLVRSGRTPGGVLRRAQLVLKAEAGPSGPGLSDVEVAEALGRGRSTVERLRKRACFEGPLACLYPKKSDRVYERVMDGEAEARLVALACSEPPAGFGKWTLRLLAERMVVLEYVEHLSYETVRQALKKTCVSLI
jgi:transposase